MGQAHPPARICCSRAEEGGSPGSPRSVWVPDAPSRATTSPHPRGTAPSVRAQGPVRTCWPLLGCAGLQGLPAQQRVLTCASDERKPSALAQQSPCTCHASFLPPDASVPQGVEFALSGAKPGDPQSSVLYEASVSTRTPRRLPPALGLPSTLPWRDVSGLEGTQEVSRAAGTLPMRQYLPAHRAAGARLKGGACEPACRKCSERGQVTGPGVCSPLLQEPGPGTREATLPCSAAPALGVSPVLRGGEGEHWSEGRAAQAGVLQAHNLRSQWQGHLAGGGKYGVWPGGPGWLV